MSKKEIFKFFAPFVIVAIVLVVVGTLFWGKIFQFPRDVRLEMQMQHETIIQQNDDMLSVMYNLQNQLSDIKSDTVSINNRLAHLKTIEEVIAIITEEME